MDKIEMTPEQQLAFDDFIDVMVQIMRNGRPELRLKRGQRRLT